MPRNIQGNREINNFPEVSLFPGAMIVFLDSVVMTDKVKLKAKEWGLSQMGVCSVAGTSLTKSS